MRGQPVQALADRGDRPGVVSSEGKGGGGSLGAIDEEANRFRLGLLLGRRRGIGKRQWADRDVVFAGEPQQYPAGHENAEVGAGGKQRR